MTDPGLTDLIAAALYAALAKAAPSGTATVDDLVASVIPAVEQHSNRRMAEAKQWDGTRASIEALARWVNTDDDLMDDPTLQYCFTSTKPDDVFDVLIWSGNDYKSVTPGDWIIRETAGEFHLCRTARAALEGEQQ